MFAAPGSGSGKTMITCGILKLLLKMRHPVAFKCGPDYIDPMFHRSVLGIPSRNLDTFFTKPDVTRYLMARGAEKEKADIAVIEGVMGYYDGLGGISTRASSYELAVQTDTPVILVVNAKGMSLSVLAVIRGFLDMYAEQRICGVILNRVSEMVFSRLRPLIEKDLHIEALGYVPETTSIHFPSRHLGLLLPEEISDLQQQIDDFASELRETVDMGRLLAIADSAPKLEEAPDGAAVGSGPEVRIGIAQDEAFCFYYEDNLELLRELGAELVPFSPMYDKSLPKGISGLYMGGGYPELHAETLSKNIVMLEAIRGAIHKGMPCLAECGAYMYLHREMEDTKGRFWPMAAVIDGRAEKKERLVRFGYTVLTAQEETILGPAGTVLPAHEFHYWDSTWAGGCFEAAKPVGNREWACMYRENNLLAGFPHFYFYGNVTAAEAYVGACRKYQCEHDFK